MNHPRIIFILAAILLATGAPAQTGISLRECLTEGIAASREALHAKLEIETANHKKQESLSMLLPQVQAYGTYDNYLKIPVQMVPGDLVGQPGTTIPISLFVQHNLTGGIRATQVLYNQTALTSLSLADRMNECSQIGSDKTREDIIFDVTSLYYGIKATEHQVALFTKTVDRLSQLKTIAESRYSGGLIRQVDVERVNVNRETMQTELDNLKLLLAKQTNLLLYSIGRTPGNIAAGTDTTGLPLSDSLQSSLLPPGYAPPVAVNVDTRTELRLLSKQMELADLNKSMAISGYLPSLSLYGQYYVQGQRSRFDFFHTDEKTWFDVAIVGLNLSIPVFDGLLKQAQIGEAEAEYLKNSNMYEFTRRNFLMEYSTTIREYKNKQEAVARQTETIRLAETVYSQTLLQYQQGAAGLSDVLEVETSLNTAYASYTSSLFQLRLSELNILRASGLLQSLLNQ